ncbi:MAG TPA: rhomboid family intramembrane serine protease, partial [Anaerolineae bacterium]
MNPLENRPAAPPPLRMPLSRPRWTYILIGIIAVVFVLEELGGGSQNPEVLIQFGANYAPLVSAGEYWRLFTANFLHIGILHIMLNAYSLYIIGQEVEAWYGASRFMAIFLLSC